MLKGQLESELKRLGLIAEAASNNIEIFRYNKSKDWALIFPLFHSLKELAMNDYAPEKEKEEAGARDDLIASQIYQGIWEADASCTFDLLLKESKQRRQRAEGFDDSIDLDNAA